VYNLTSTYFEGATKPSKGFESRAFGYTPSASRRRGVEASRRRGVEASRRRGGELGACSCRLRRSPAQIKGM
jgi:hypothetical protein